LKGLAPDELAVEVLPALGQDGARGGRFARARDVCLWLMRSHHIGFDASPLELLAAVLKALRCLEHVGLAWSTESDIPTRWKLTRHGEQALADGTAAQWIAVLARLSAGAGELEGKRSTHARSSTCARVHGKPMPVPAGSTIAPAGRSGADDEHPSPQRRRGRVRGAHLI
jgi:hypothetical protein